MLKTTPLHSRTSALMQAESMAPLGGLFRGQLV